jgi:hypothetical protein
LPTVAIGLRGAGGLGETAFLVPTAEHNHGRLPTAAIAGGASTRGEDLALAGRWLQRWVNPGVVGWVDGRAGRDDLVDAVEQGLVEDDVARASWPSRCSIVRGPMIGAVMAGWLRTNAIASWMSVIPASSAGAVNCSTASSLRWLADTDISGSRAARDEAGKVEWPM